LTPEVDEFGDYDEGYADDKENKFAGDREFFE